MTCLYIYIYIYIYIYVYVVEHAVVEQAIADILRVQTFE